MSLEVSSLDGGACSPSAGVVSSLEDGACSPSSLLELSSLEGGVCSPSSGGVSISVSLSGFPASATNSSLESFAANAGVMADNETLAAIPKAANFLNKWYFIALPSFHKNNKFLEIKKKGEILKRISTSPKYSM